MAYLGKRVWPMWLAIGLLLGLVIGGLWPDTPLHAVATDSTESFAMATGFVDEGLEAVYFLDFLMGTLGAAVLSNQTPRFQASYMRDVNADLARVVGLTNAALNDTNAERRKFGQAPLTPIQMPQSPNYLMATGVVDIRRGAAARARPAQAVLYVAETTTGILLAYIIPWEQSAHAQDRPVLYRELQLLTWGRVTAPIMQTP